MHIALTRIVVFLPHIKDYCGVMVTHRHTKIWIFGLCHCTEGCCHSAVMLPHIEIWIFGFPHHAEGIAMAW
jgi:hypothetical protein